MGAKGREDAGSAQSEARNLPRVCKPTLVPFRNPQPNRSVKGDHHVCVCSGVKWKGLRRVLTEFICSLGWFCILFDVLNLHLFVEVGPMRK